MVYISACHAEDPGSIPGGGAFDTWQEEALDLNTCDYCTHRDGCPGMTPSAKLALQVETRRFTNSSKLDRSRDLPKHLEHTPATANLVADAHTTSTPVLLQPLPTSARHLQTTTRKMKKGTSETRNQSMQRKCACNGELLSPAPTKSDKPGTMIAHSVIGVELPASPGQKPSHATSGQTPHRRHFGRAV